MLSVEKTAWRVLDNESSLLFVSLKQSASSSILPLKNKLVFKRSKARPLSPVCLQLKTSVQTMEEANKCNLCGKEFVSRSNLNVHIRSYHEGIRRVYKRNFKCNVCGYEFTCRRNLKHHMSTHSDERPFQCTVAGCTQTFKLERAVKSHIRYRHKNERPCKCSFAGCTYAANTSSNLAEHFKVHSDENLFACSYSGCNFTTKRSCKVKRHLESVHNKIQAFACSKCDYKTARSDALKSHMRRHSTRRDFKCSHPHCPESFNSSDKLKRHFSNRHGERNVQCDHPGCGQNFASTTALSVHKSRVHAKKSHACPNLSCNYSTNAEWKLAEHVITHTGRDEKIPCPIEGCDFKAKNRKSMTSHVSRHKTHVPRPLSGFGRSAVTKKAMKDDDDGVKIIHAMPRPFQCPLCVKRFQTQHHLHNHCVAHTNEKPFRCGHCEYTTSRHTHVKSHICSVHASLQFPFIVHLVDDRECLRCKVTLPSAEFFVHCKGHVVPDVVI